ncbi:MAG: type IV pilus modification PilV family protein [Myxococcota bacterium]
MRGARRRSRGSTVIEVLMAISVLAVGASGIIAMQKVTTVANRNAKNLEIANEIARTWVERLQADAMLWNHPSPAITQPDLGDTQWLSQVTDPSTLVWFRPEDGTENLYGVHYATGADDRSGDLNGPFCVNIRLSWLRQNAMMRAEVRVYWLRDGIQPHKDDLSEEVPNPMCGAAASPAPPVEGAQDVFHYVYVTTALRKNSPL